MASQPKVEFLIKADPEVIAAVAATLRGRVEQTPFDHRHFSRETWTMVEEIALGLEQHCEPDRHLWGGLVGKPVPVSA